MSTETNDSPEKTAGEPAQEKNVEMVIEVSEDKFEAYFTLVPLTDSPKFSLAEISEALANKEILFGIRYDIFPLLAKEPRYNKKHLIASGIRPKKGKHGKIVFSKENKEAVKMGDKIAEIIPHESGVDGVTVFGEKVPVSDVGMAIIPPLTNVEFSPENDRLLIAGVDGYLYKDPDSIIVKPLFKLEENVNDYEAYIEVTKPPHKNDINSEDLKRFLQNCGIIYGILEEELDNIFQQEKFDQRILIAQGREVMHGKDGKIIFNFSPEVKHIIDDDGNADYKEINLIKNVKEGDKLAEIIPPVKGIEGCTIYGEKTLPKEGAVARLTIGQNVQRAPDNPEVLLAKIDGHVKLKGDQISVTPLFTVQNDVDFSTGNIHFIGSVLVRGDVKSGFKIDALNDIQVDGVVEDAVIEAGGSVLLKKGFIGKGAGKIIANEVVRVLFCENENIISKGDIYIKDYVMHSNIRTGGKLVVKGKRGLIVGGDIYACKGIEANMVGNDNHVPTKLSVAADEKDKGVLLQRLVDNWRVIDQEIIRINAHLEGLERLKQIKKSLPEDQKITLDTLSKLKAKKETLAKHLIGQIKILESKINELKGSVVKIAGTVYPNTSITIFDKSILVNEYWEYICFKYVSNEEELVPVDLEHVS